MPAELEQQEGQDEIEQDVSQTLGTGVGEGQKQELEPKKEKPDELRQALTELAGTVKTLATPKKEERQLTQAEINKQWAVFNPEEKNPKFFHEFFNLAEDADPKLIEAAKARFAYMHEGMMKQAITGARNLMMQELSKRDERFTQLEEKLTKREASDLRTSFSTSYPALADKKYAKILTIVAKELDNKDFVDHDDYFKALAEGAAGYIKEFLPDFDLGATAATQPTRTTPRLPRTSVGGSGGQGGGKVQKVSDDDSDSLD